MSLAAGRDTRKVVQGNDDSGLHEEGAGHILKRGDGTVMVGEGGLLVYEDLRFRLASVFRWRIRWSTVGIQSGADVALAQSEASPDPLQSSGAQVAVGSADGGGDAAGDGALEEAPEHVGREAEPSDFVGEPDADSASTAGSGIAIAAEYATSADGLPLWIGLVESVQEAMQIECSDGCAVRTVGEFELFSDRAPILGAAVEPLQLAHTGASPKRVIIPAWGQGGVVAGYDVRNLERGSG